MMSGFQRAVDLEHASAIRGFVRTFGLRARLWTALVATTRHALVAALSVCLVELAIPRWTPALALASAVWIALVFVWSLARTRVRLRSADRQLGLHDRLLTYAQLPAEREQSEFGVWLGRDLASRLAGLPDRVVAHAWRRPLGALRYAVPLLVVLLLLRLFAPLPPSTPEDSGPPLETAQGGGQAGGGGPADSDSESRETPPEEPTEGEDAPPEDQGAEEDPAPDVEEGPPPPELDVQVVDEFVIPQFIGEGETRRALSNTALLERGGDPRSAAQAPAPDVPEPSPIDFEAAVEQALRSRHVQPSERAFVRTYFEQLLEEVR